MATLFILVLYVTSDYTKDSNYLYAIPLKEFYTERSRSAQSLLSHNTASPTLRGPPVLLCPLESQFLRLAVAVKTKILMIAYKHAAIMTVNGSPKTPITCTCILANPMDNFVKHWVTTNNE